MSAAAESFTRAHALQASRGGPFASTERAAAWERFSRAGLPQAKTEAWRYAPATRLWERRLLPAIPRRLDFSARELPPLLPGSNRVVFLDGRFEARLSTIAPVTGVWLRAASSFPWPLPKVDAASALVELNRALYEEAAVIELAGRADAGTVEVLHLALDPQDGAMVHPRIQVHLENDARLTLVETYLSRGGASSFVNATTEVHLEPGARLDHVTLQDEAPGAVHLGGLQARQERGSVLRAHHFQVGAVVGRREVRITLAGEGARAELGGLALTGAGQHHDQHAWIDHAAARCTSRQEFRGVARGDGRAAFTGHTRVQPHAQKTDAGQRARGLLLSPEAEIDLRPHLEIHADDVKAVHGASVGELDPAQLFFLRARGIPEGEARQLLLGAFTAQALDALETFAAPGLRARLESMLRMGA